MGSTRFRVCHLALFSQDEETVAARIVMINFASEIIFSKAQARRIGIQLVNQKVIRQIDFDQLNVDILQSPLPDTLSPRLVHCTEAHDDIPADHYHWFGAHNECSPAFFSRQAGSEHLKRMAEHDCVPVDDVPRLNKSLREQDKIAAAKTQWDHAIESRITRGTIKAVSLAISNLQILEVSIG